MLVYPYVCVYGIYVFVYKAYMFIIYVYMGDMFMYVRVYTYCIGLYLDFKLQNLHVYIIILSNLKKSVNNADNGGHFF